MMWCKLKMCKYSNHIIFGSLSQPKVNTWVLFRMTKEHFFLILELTSFGLLGSVDAILLFIIYPVNMRTIENHHL